MPQAYVRPVTAFLPTKPLHESRPRLPGGNAFAGHRSNGIILLWYAEVSLHVTSILLVF